MSLVPYKRKRRFDKTPEPVGKVAKRNGALRFVVQLHDASRKHYDLRLELDGTMKSWAVPKGPSTDPLERRLAVAVEDHPLAYNQFEGIIPPGNYGAGTVMIWDEGTYTARGNDPLAKDDADELRRGLARGHLTFVLSGSKLKGEFALVRLRKGEANAWLLLKKHDQHASRADVTNQDRSARSQRTLGEIAATAAEEKKVWLPKRGLQDSGVGNKTRTREVKADSAAQKTNAKAPSSARTAKAGKAQAGKAAFAKAKAGKAKAGKAKAGKAKAGEAEAGKAEVGKAKAEKAAREKTKASLPPRSLNRRLLAGAPKGSQLAPVKLPRWLSTAQPPPSRVYLRHTVLDGYRVQVLGESGNVRLLSATQIPLSARFPDLCAALRQVPWSFGGEGIVVPLDAAGEPRQRGRAASAATCSYVLYLYDLFYLDGRDLTACPVSLRWRLAQSLAHAEWGLRLAPELGEKPAYEASHTTVLTRPSDSPYVDDHGALPCYVVKQSLRRPTTTADIAIPESDSAPAAPSQHDLARRTGHPHAPTAPGGQRDLVRRTARAHAAPVPGSRHDVVRRAGHGASPTQPLLSNVTKIYWPADGRTKGDLINYYREAGPIILPHLRDRPQSLHRHPNGIDHPSFFQKEVAGAVPGWMPTATINSGRSGKAITYLLCQDLAGLLFMANYGCIELNTWLSRVDSLNHPDYVVFDLDPGEIAFTAVIEAALVLHRLLDTIGAPNYCKTSGATGLHIYVPIAPVSSYDDVRLFAEKVCRIVHEKLPATTSLERSPARRVRQIYLDFLQNRAGQTMAAPYSVRPRPGAPVSTPLRWSEVKRSLNPTLFTVVTTIKRMHKLGDLWPLASTRATPLSALDKALRQVYKLPT